MTLEPQIESELHQGPTIAKSILLGGIRCLVRGNIGSLQEADFFLALSFRGKFSL